MILAVCANPSVDSFWSFDEINKSTTNRSQSETFYPGGKGIHVAFALNELEEKVILLGVWGGVTGQWLRHKCHERDIATLGPYVDEWTRICITNCSSSEWNETELLGAGPSLDSSHTKKFMSSYRKQFETCNLKAVVISGSAATGFDNELYYKLAKTAEEFEVPVYTDAAGDLLEKALEAKPFAVHINQEEGRELSGYSRPADIARWLSGHCTVAAVTAGANGLFLAAGGKLYHTRHKLETSEIDSTVGAGDCLLAGLCLASLKNDNYEFWASYATACGSANCVHEELGMLRAEDVTNFLPEIVTKTFDI